MGNWKNVTKKQIGDLKKNTCIYCDYFINGNESHINKVFDNGANYGICNYLEMENHSRPCSPFECRKQGVFKPVQPKKRKGKGIELR